MKRLCALTGVFALSIVAAHADVIFDNLSGADEGSRTCTSEYAWIAEEFIVPDSNYILDSVTLRLSAADDGDAIAYIFEHATDRPDVSGTIRSLGTVTGFSDLMTPHDKRFVPPSQIILNANTTYWIVVKAVHLSDIEWHLTSDSPTTGSCIYGSYYLVRHSGTSVLGPFNPSGCQFQMKIEGSITALPVELDSFIID